MNRDLQNSRSRLCAAIKNWENAAPGRSTCFAGKPRDPDERFHAHASNVVSPAGQSKMRRFFLFFQLFDFLFPVADRGPMNTHRAGHRPKPRQGHVDGLPRL
jgi:hypothetical protein